jgi:hypothetical protein
VDKWLRLPHPVVPIGNVPTNSQAAYLAPRLQINSNESQGSVYQRLETGRDGSEVGLQRNEAGSKQFKIFAKRGTEDGRQ